MNRYRVLVVDDEIFTRDFFVNLLENDEYEVIQATGGPEAIEKCQVSRFDLVLLDLQMPGMGGLEVLRELKAMDDNLSILIMTGHGTIDSAIEAMKLGAEDYLTKPFENLEELKLVVQKVIGYKRLREENRFLKTQLKPGHIIGNSRKMEDVYRMIHKVAPLNSTILITGESGTGKELVARTIHDLSPRSGKRFVAVNCGGLPENLLESSLFGHEKGAFTGAIRTSRGYFEEASGGTLFLDEIGETSPMLQVRLLRALQEKTFERVGGTRPIRTDIRIITATNTDLTRLVESKSFREDLYYRINVIRISLPPLREREDDIPLLSVHFLKKYNKEFGKTIVQFSREVMEAMQEYPWPGNVRELENVVERAVALEEKEEITLSSLPPQVVGKGDVQGTFAGTSNFREAKDQFEKAFIIEALKRTNGNVTKAARECGLARQNFHKKIIKYNVNIKDIV
jgi:DNA-binding NtrC family response regulator